MKSSIRLFRVAGIDIGIHYSWLFIFALISISMSLQYFPEAYSGGSTISHWLLGIAAALVIFASVLLHELAHSLVARARGMSVNSITLFILGGVSNLEDEPEKPKIEFSMAIVGPLTSLVLGGIFFGLFWLSGGDIETPQGAFLYIIGYLNLVLAIFNLLPGFPLDGGRVLRSIIWSATGSLLKATNIAAAVGRFFGWALIIVGLLSVFGFVGLGLLGGIWLAFIGWFLSSAADSSRKQVLLNELLAGRKVRDIMSPRPETVTTDLPVDELVSGIFNRQHGRAVPVCQGGKLIGIVTITDVKGLPRDRWAGTTVGDIMTKPPLYTVSPDDDVSKAIPAEALGKMVKIEFRFTSDDISNFAGWYIDDVVVTVP